MNVLLILIAHRECITTIQGGYRVVKESHVSVRKNQTSPQPSSTPSPPPTPMGKCKSLKKKIPLSPWIQTQTFLLKKSQSPPP